MLLDWLFEFVSSFFTTLWEGVLWAINGLIELFGYFLFLIFDGLLLTIYSFFSLIDISEAVFNYGASYSSLPPQLIYLCNAVDLPQMFAYIAGAIVIRMTINLIPAAFTRI